MKNSQCYFIVWALLAIATGTNQHPLSRGALSLCSLGFLVAAIYELSKEPK